MKGEKERKRTSRKGRGGEEKREYYYGSEGITKSKSILVILLMGLLLTFQIVSLVVREVRVRDARTGEAELRDTSGKAPVADCMYPAVDGIKVKEKSVPGKTFSPKRRNDSRSLFEFDPNTVSIDSLQLLGFSYKQAAVLSNYRDKGGVFREKSDLAKIYSVSESMYERLYDYIVISEDFIRDTPRSGRADFIIELNSADSADLVRLYGIGGYYAGKIMQYRKRLGAFYSPEQLMEIAGIDSTRFSGFAKNVTVDTSYIKPFSLDTAGRAFMMRHPYIGAYAARGIILYREMSGSDSCNIANLVKENILPADKAGKLRHYVVSEQK